MIDSPVARPALLSRASVFSEPLAIRPSQTPVVDVEKIDILLVDDREENLIALEAVLAAPSYNLIRASSGAEALRYLLHQDPALILMDVQMPEMDGYETASVIKKNERTREIPIIFITAINKEDQYALKGYDHGAVDYIHKPFDPHILKSKVGIFADLYRKTRRLIRMERELRDSERKEREREIAQLELKSLKREQADQKKYRDLIEGIDHGMVWSADAHSLAVSFVSPRAEQIVGFPIERWSEENFLLDVVHLEDRDAMREAIRLARAGMSDIALEHRILKSDGQIAWLHTGIRMGQKSNGWGQELRGLSVDITRLKITEEAMARSKRRSEFMAEASHALSQSLDYAETLSHIGKLAVPAIADWYTIDLLTEEGELETLSFVDHDLNQLSKDRQKNREKLLRSVVKSRQSKSLIDQDESVMVVPLIAHGKMMGVLVLGAKVRGHGYDAVDLSMAEDLARRVAVAIDNARLYKQAQEAVRARDEFLSIASHELKTPLTPLKLQTQSLMRALATPSVSPIKPDRVLKMLRSADKQITKLTQLIDDLLDISRISIGRVSLNLEEFDAVELVHETVDRFREQLSNDHCEVEIEAPEQLMVCLDRFRIEQVVINLLTNAMKYGAGKPISIRVAVQNGRFAFSFRDQGIGIEKKDQERIFHRFERAVSGTHFGGLGLGLYIVTQILAAHQGKIAVESEPGSGSTFIVDLPITLGN